MMDTVPTIPDSLHRLGLKPERTKILRSISRVNSRLTSRKLEVGVRRLFHYILAWLISTPDRLRARPRPMPMDPPSSSKPCLDARDRPSDGRGNRILALCPTA